MPLPSFEFEFRGRNLREGDVVDSVYRNQFIYDAIVIRPECPEYGYDGETRDYKVEVRVGSHRLVVKRGDIMAVRRPYQTGDWLAV